MKNSYWLFGANLTILASEPEVSSYELIEGHFPPGSETPLHKHLQYSEFMYVLEGEATVYMPGKTISLLPGDTAFIPVGTPHVVANSSAIQPFKALVVSSPGGFAKLIRSVGFPGAPDQQPAHNEHDMQLAQQIFEEIGDVNMGPPGSRPS